MAWKWQQGDTGQGLLNAEQHLLWSGDWPDEALCRELPALMEAAHFRSVERYSFGAVRCRREGGQVACRLFGWHRLPALVFTDAGTRVTATVVERVWSMSPGLMARRHTTPEAPYGTLTVGLEHLPAGALPAGAPLVGAATHLHAYERVDAFPSRFLRPPAALSRAVAAEAAGAPWWQRPARWLRRGPLRAWAWTQVGALYSAYHARASFACLHRIAALLGAPLYGAWRPLPVLPEVAAGTRPAAAVAAPIGAGAGRGREARKGVS